MNKVWVVVKQAVYLHDMFGPFYTFRAAWGAAQTLALEDIDDHHQWCVYRLSPDEGLVDQYPQYFRGVSTREGEEVLPATTMHREVT